MQMATPSAARDARKPEFVLKFAGKPDEISASTFLESLSGITSVLQEANREIGTGEAIDVKIRAPKPGSFVVHLILDPATVAHFANLFEIGTGVIGVLVAAIKTWQFLAGRPPKTIEQREDGNVSITNESGQVLIEDQKITNFVLNNSTVTFNLSRTFGALDGDPNVTALQMLDRDQIETLVDVPRDEFSALSIAPAPPSEQKRDITVRTRLTIVKPSFDPKLRWEFVFNGTRVGATVNDPNFISRIDRGEKFAKGDTLDVSLRMKQEYDAKLRAYMNRSYEVAIVHAHVQGAEQDGFDFEENDG